MQHLLIADGVRHGVHIYMYWKDGTVRSVAPYSRFTSRVPLRFLLHWGYRQSIERRRAMHASVLIASWGVMLCSEN
mgnify:CR=1 FL=1|jgi:hypothetical protein